MVVKVDTNEGVDAQKGKNCFSALPVVFGYGNAECCAFELILVVLDSKGA